MPKRNSDSLNLEIRLLGKMMKKLKKIFKNHTKSVLMDMYGNIVAIYIQIYKIKKFIYKKYNKNK